MTSSLASQEPSSSVQHEHDGKTTDASRNSTARLSSNFYVTPDIPDSTPALQIGATPLCQPSNTDCRPRLPDV